MTQNWSFQLYSARNFQPWTDVLKMLAEAGYAEVEGFGAVYGDPAAFRTELDRNGLTMPTGHFSIDALETDLGNVIAMASTLGMKRIYCPYILPANRPSDAAGWQGFARRLQAVGEKVKAAGFGFGWHNHDFEFAALADGSLPMQHILDSAPGIDWEMDVAWVVRGGSEPQDWISRHGPRITAVHVKDIAPQGQNTNEDGWADVGHGIINWQVLMKSLRQNTPARSFIMEHDNPSDIGRFARRSIASLNAFGA